MESIKMPAPCVGTLQKTHRRSKFVRFHVTSKMAGWVFSDRPHLHENDAVEIVVLRLSSMYGRQWRMLQGFEKGYIYLRSYGQENVLRSQT